MPMGLSRRLLLGGAAALAAGGSVYGFQGNQRMQRSAAADAKTLNRGNGAEPSTLDPHLATGDWENNIVGDMFMGLMTEAPDGTAIPGAAERFAVSADGLTYTFRLRKHSWSDGKPVTAEDFVYSLRRVLNPATAAQYASILYPIHNARAVNAGKLPLEKLGVRALDARTLEIKFHFQVPYIAQLLAHYSTFPVPRHIVEKYGSDWLRPENIAVNGPYVLKEWVANDHIRLARNPRFYDSAKIAIENVYFFPTQDSAAALKRFRGGEFDVLSGSIPPQQTVWLKREIPAELRLHPYMLTQYILFNFDRPPFDNLAVRTALSLGIDREIIVDKVTRGGETAAYSLVPPGMPGYPGKAQLAFRNVPMAVRRERARELLKEAGYGPNRPLRFNYEVESTTEARLVAVVLQEMWREIGAEAQITQSESQVHYDLLLRRDFDVAWTGWSADYLDPKDFLFTLDGDTSMNNGNYESAIFNALMHDSDLERDTKLRAELLEQAEQRMLNDMAVAPVYFGVTRNLVSTDVQGWVPNSVNINRTRWLWLRRARAAA